jgi:hypothetical protein
MKSAIADFMLSSDLSGFGFPARASKLSWPSAMSFLAMTSNIWVSPVNPVNPVE